MHVHVPYSLIIKLWSPPYQTQYHASGSRHPLISEKTIRKAGSPAAISAVRHVTHMSHANHMTITLHIRNNII